MKLPPSRTQGTDSGHGARRCGNKVAAEGEAALAEALKGKKTHCQVRLLHGVL